MKLGTKSVLFGYHQFLLHPMLVAIGWIRLFGWTWDWKRWLSFFVHDLGYIGKPNMDGDEGEKHPIFGAQLMFWATGDNFWFLDALCHSRTYARIHGQPISDLCFADKFAFLMYPKWLLRLLYGLSGEFEEYRRKRYDAGTKVNCEPMTFNEWFVQAIESNYQTLRKAGYRV